MSRGRFFGVTGTVLLTTFFQKVVRRTVPVTPLAPTIEISGSSRASGPGVVCVVGASYLPVGLRKLFYHILHPCHLLNALQNSEISVEFPLRWADLIASEKFASMKETLLSSTWMQITTEIAS